MKTTTVIVVVMFLSLNACRKDYIPINGTIDLKYNTPKILSEDGYKITVDAVEDSRCPVEVVCFWPGNAKVSFTFTVKDNLSKFDLNTFPGFVTDTLIGHYRVRLNKVMPQNSVNNPPEQSDYVVEVTITTE